VLKRRKVLEKNGGYYLLCLPMPMPVACILYGRMIEGLLLPPGRRPILVDLQRSFCGRDLPVGDDYHHHRNEDCMLLHLITQEDCLQEGLPA